MGRFSLILVVGFTIIAGTMKMNHSRIAREATNVGYERYEEASARQYTNSAINLCLFEVSRDFDWRTGYSQQSIGCGQITATVYDSDTDSTLSLDELRISATGSFGSLSTAADVKVRKSAFSEFAYFTDYEPVIYFITGDTLRGPIHTNGQFHIWGDPVFYGHVSQVASNYYGSGNPEFKAGRNFGCDPINLPVDMSILRGRAQSGGSSFENDVEIEFLSDGTFDWATTRPETTYVYRRGRWRERINQVPVTGNTTIATMNGVIATENGSDVHVKGILDGKATVLSDGNMWIEDDILYKDDPLTSPNANDMLGLISRNNVYVTDNAANQNDCVIHGTVMALNSKFQVENYSSGSPRGTLTILGGLVQDRRGAVGTFGYGGIRSGYQKNYVYDQRFLTRAPPFYPVFTRNTITAWYE